MDWKWSKNKMWLANQTRKGAKSKRMNPESRARRDLLELTLGADLARRRARFRRPKNPKLFSSIHTVWIRFHVTVPDWTGDAVNVIDLACDAARRAVGIDDNRFAIHGLSVEKDKINPTIRVWVGQSSDGMSG